MIVIKTVLREKIYGILKQEVLIQNEKKKGILSGDKKEINSYSNKIKHNTNVYCINSLTL